MRFYDVPVNQSVPPEANRGLTSYITIRLSSQMSAQLRRVQVPTKSGVFDFHGRNGNLRCLNPQKQVESLHKWYELVCG
jgi:hypothetical protein